MKITEVSPQKKNPKRFNVFIDGQFAFGADEDLVVNQRLVLGKELFPDDLEKILYESEVGKLMERMYRLFNVRQRSEKEVRDYLKDLSFKRKVLGDEVISDLTVDLVVERLKEKGMVNDEAFTRTWIESRRRSKKKGVVALKVELFQKGIDRETVTKVLEENHSDEEGMAQETLEKKINIWKNLPSLEFKRKAIDFLLRKGFEYQVVRKVVEKVSQKA